MEASSEEVKKELEYLGLEYLPFATPNEWTKLEKEHRERVGLDGRTFHHCPSSLAESF